MEEMCSVKRETREGVEMKWRKGKGEDEPYRLKTNLMKAKNQTREKDTANANYTNNSIKKERRAEEKE